MPRLAPGSNKLRASRRSEDLTADASLSAKSKASSLSAPPAWFIPKPSSTAPVIRPSFLPPPARTEPLPEGEVRPPPKQLPKDLRELWVHLHSHPLIKPGSVQFISTARPAPKTIPILAHPPRNGRRNRGFADGGEGIGGLEIGGWWDWQVVCVVEGRGSGDVRRGELAIREWLSLNPLHYKGKVSSVTTKVVRPVKGTPPPEWSQIDTGAGVAINVMTTAADERYDLRGIWANSL